ncbi:MAG: 2-C-methyl-D-erythritol 2,4-cyclodiphosphate synthase [Ruminococcaceae bacterium]|nr:2-C-methyl-D-erythritol 2,4-cyclodiphosphate synthase [Oscillospiraceae bacterium]
MRIGFGYDVHRLIVGRELILGGISIPYDLGLDGHSDADVLSHAIIDAILGAAALGDIGSLFPDTDLSFKNIKSLILLSRANKEIEASGYKISNIDATVVAQEPKLSSFILEMRKSIADCLNIGVDQVSVKATTEEKLGFTGTGEGIAAYAVALLE